ncbi:hypothetical protein [Streptomyces roseifaciens]|nr:hypothetical protein [Streptomyces roseifaciens]
MEPPAAEVEVKVGIEIGIEVEIEIGIEVTGRPEHLPCPSALG